MTKSGFRWAQASLLGRKVFDYGKFQPPAVRVPEGLVVIRNDLVLSSSITFYRKNETITMIDEANDYCCHCFLNTGDDNEKLVRRPIQNPAITELSLAPQHSFESGILVSVAKSIEEVLFVRYVARLVLDVPAVYNRYMIPRGRQTLKGSRRPPDQKWCCD